MTIDEITRRLQPVLAGHPDIEAVFLFGSHATGNARPESGPGAGGTAYPAGGAEARSTGGTAGFDNIDLVVPDEADPALKFEAARPNRLVFPRPGFDRGGYYARVIREYFDF
jgi:hypothetical protein